MTMVRHSGYSLIELIMVVIIVAIVSVIVTPQLKLTKIPVARGSAQKCAGAS